MGLDLAVSSMKKGELARVIIRPQYAFGEMGTPPRIPKDATGKKSVFYMTFFEQLRLISVMCLHVNPEVQFVKYALSKA